MLLGTPDIRYTKPGGIAVTESGLGLPSMDDAMAWGKEQAKGAAGSAGKKALAAARKKGGSAVDRAQSELEKQVHKKTGISIAEKKVRVKKGKKKAAKKGAAKPPKQTPGTADEVVTKIQGNKMVVAGAAVIVLGGLMLMLRK